MGLAAAVLACLAAGAARAASVLMYHNDNTGSGVNPEETLLTPANVTGTNFAKRYATPVDGNVYAQPLYLPGVEVTGGPHAGTHNLVFIATEHDSLYAIDADNGKIVWRTSFTVTGLPGATSIAPMPAADTFTSDTAPEIGITSTPVIDPATNMLYVTAKTKQIVAGNASVPHYVYTLYKIDITDGNATPNANIVASTLIGDTQYNPDTTAYTYRTASSANAAQDIFVPGTGDGAITVNGQSRVYFNAVRQLQRTGLLLYDGKVFLGFGSHGDNGPFHGWFLAYDAGTLAVAAVLTTTPNGGLGGLWASGAAPVVDANGFLYITTGNGTFDGYNNNGVAAGLDSLGFPVNGNFGDSVIKVALDPATTISNPNRNGWGLRIVDYFAPFNNQALDSADTDLGSGGITLLPDSAGNAAHPHLLVEAGKQGNVYLLDRDALGKYTATTDNVVQSQTIIGPSFGAAAFFNGIIYYLGGPDNLKAFTMADATMSTAPVSSTDYFSWPGGTPQISANGSANGIVWCVDRGSAQLRAYAAGNIAHRLWSSGDQPTDALGAANKFTPVTIADGKVFVATASALVTYGPPSAATKPPAAPTALTATPVSSLQIELSWTDNADNENGYAVEESTDGATFTEIARPSANATSYSVSNGLTAGGTYFFRVRAFNNFEGTSFSAYSNVASATTPSTGASLNFSAGFGNASSALTFNGSARVANNRAQLTDGGTMQAGSVFSTAEQDIHKFSTQFTFQLSSANADGITFTLQNQANNALGSAGGGLGYAGISHSVAVKFDLYANNGEGANSTGLFLNGAEPFTPATDLTSAGINLHSGDVFSVALNYDGATLAETITDTVTGATRTLSYPVDIPGTVGSITAYAGFTGATGNSTATQEILSWTYAPAPTSAPAAPTNLKAAAVSGTEVNLTWTDNANNESGFIILRATGSGNYTQVGVAGAGAASFSDPGLVADTTYSYQVEATNSVGNSALSNAVTITTPEPPARPTKAVVTAVTQNSIAMTWTNNSTNETTINILRKMTTASNFIQIMILPPKASAYTDTGLAPGTTYDYHIQASNVAGYSDFAGVTATTLSGSSLPVVTLSTSQAVSVNGVTTGQITFRRSSPFTAPLAVAYQVSGSAKPGADYAPLPGTVTIPAGSGSASIPVSASATTTASTTVTAGIASTSAYTAGSPASGTVVLEGTSFNAAAQTQYPTATVSGPAGGNITLTFSGLPNSPTGAVYVWYFNGAAVSATNTPTYTLTNATTAQAGAYAVYAWAPGGITGSETWNVTVGEAKAPPAIDLNDGQTAADLAGASPVLTGANIGADAGGGATVRASGKWWVDGRGPGSIDGVADSFHFESRALTGDFRVDVQLQDLDARGGSAAHAGLMIRDGASPGAAFLALGGTAAPSGGYALTSRTVANAAATDGILGATYTYPKAWLRLTRVGNVLRAFVSADGATYTEVTDPARGVTWPGMSNALGVGVFAASGSTADVRAVFSHFSITAGK